MDLHEWIFQRRQKTQDWKLPENTIMYLKGIEEDLAELSQQLGVDLCIMTIQREEK